MTQILMWINKVRDMEEESSGISGGGLEKSTFQMMCTFVFG